MKMADVEVALTCTEEDFLAQRKLSTHVGIIHISYIH